MIISIELDANDMRGMSAIADALISLQTWVSVEVNESPIVARCNNFLAVTAIDSVDVRAISGRWEDTLDWPAEFTSECIPLLISKLSSSACHLLACLGVEEEVLVGSTIRLNELTVD